MDYPRTESKPLPLTAWLTAKFNFLPHFSNDFTANCNDHGKWDHAGSKRRPPVTQDVAPCPSRRETSAAPLREPNISYIISYVHLWHSKCTDRYAVEGFVVCHSEYRNSSKSYKSISVESNMNLIHQEILQGCIPCSMEFRILPLWARRVYTGAAICRRSGGSTCGCIVQRQCFVPALPRRSSFPPDCQCRLHYNLVECFTERRCKDKTNTLMHSFLLNVRVEHGLRVFDYSLIRAVFLPNR